MTSKQRASLKASARHSKKGAATLVSASFMGSFALTAMLSFWLLWNRWSGHWWNGGQEWRGCCWLLRMLLIKGVDQLPEIYDCQWKLPDVFFFQIAFSQNEVIEAWDLIAICLLTIHRAVKDYFDLILLIISCLILFFWLWQSFVIHLPFPSGILLQ